MFTVETMRGEYMYHFFLLQFELHATGIIATTLSQILAGMIGRVQVKFGKLKPVLSLKQWPIS